MMRTILLALAVLTITGCSTQDLRVSGMICPEGHTEEMVHRDFRECRVYDEKAAERASYPKQLAPECVQCLEERGYTVDEK